MAKIGEQLKQPEVGWKRYDNSDVNIAYEATWEHSTGLSENEYYNGTNTGTRITGSKLKFGFTGTKLRIIGLSTSNGSKAIFISIDGVIESFSQYSSSPVYMSLVYEKSGLANKDHTVEMWLGDSDYLRFDALDIDEDGKLKYFSNVTNEFYLIQASSRQYLSFKQQQIDNETAVPKMTSNTTPIGRAFAKDIYTTDYDAWKAFDQVDDNDGYCSKNGSGGVGFLGYEFVQAIVIRKYVVRSMARSANLITMPKDWTFEGSNDGVEWQVLDTQKNQTWTTINTDKDYYIDDPKSYKMYRLNWSANNGFTLYSGVNELKMYRGSNLVTRIPTLNKNYLLKYGMDKLTEETFKNNCHKVGLVSNKERNLNEGKIFEHEIDLKKYEVNKISTIVNKMSLSGNGENYKNIAPKLIPSAVGTFSGVAESDLYKAIEGDGILTSGKYVGFYSPTTASPVIFMLRPNDSAIKLNRIRIAFGVSDWVGNTTASDFEVQISKNSTALINDPSTSTNWGTIYSINGNSKKDFIEIKPTTSVITPMIRIIIYKSAHTTYLTISEVEVYGEEVNGYMLIKPEIDSYLNSVSDSQLIYLRNIMNEDKFTRYGFRKGESVDFTKELENKMYVSDEATPLGSGKVFRQKIEKSKVPIKKVSIE